jgi:hypothetical protein
VRVGTTPPSQKPQPPFPRLVAHVVVAKNSVGIAIVEFVGQWNYIPAACVNSFFRCSIHFLVDLRLGLDCVIIALLHQLAVLERKVPARPKLKLADRWLWVVLSLRWSAWHSSLVIVKPEAVGAWHRKGFRLYWTWKSRSRFGRPKINTEARELIQEMSRVIHCGGTANPR